MPAKRRRPLRGVGEGPRLAKEALAVELGRRVQEDQPQSWAAVAELGLEVASVVLGPEPPQDSRPWVVGSEAELQQHHVAVAKASSRKRSAVDEEEWCSAQKAWRQTKRRRSAWLRDKEVSWWEGQASKIQDVADAGDSFGWGFLYF